LSEDLEHIVLVCPGIVNPLVYRHVTMFLIIRYNTLWLFNIAMENGSFIDDFPIKTSIYKGFSMAMLNNQMVSEILGYPMFGHRDPQGQTPPTCSTQSSRLPETPALMLCLLLFGGGRHATREKD
jgi:hypothetical protein